MATSNPTNPRIKIFKFPFVYLIAVLACCLFLPACTVHKKLNENGYGVFWKKNNVLRNNEQTMRQFSHPSTNGSSVSELDVSDISQKNTPHNPTQLNEPITCQRESSIWMLIEKSPVKASTVQSESFLPLREHNVSTWQNKRQLTKVRSEHHLKPLPIHRTYFPHPRLSLENPKILPLAIWAFVFAFILPPLGLILGIKSLKKIEKNPQRFTGKQLSVASIMIGALLSIPFLLIGVIILLFAIIGGGTGWI
jgi:hypothetical protein